MRDACLRDRRAATCLFETFHCFPAASVIRMRQPRTIPRVLVLLGRLRGLIYSSDRGSPGCPRNYVHFMRRPPLLVCNPSGSQLYVVGGGYRVTRRGIEG